MSWENPFILKCSSVYKRKLYVLGAGSLHNSSWLTGVSYPGVPPYEAAVITCLLLGLGEPECIWSPYLPTATASVGFGKEEGGRVNEVVKTRSR